MRSSDLDAYLDGELAAEHRAALEHTFRRSPEAVEKLVVQQRLKKAVQRSALEDPVPDSVRTRLLTRLLDA
ncbi:MAG: hypothetical protein AB1758_11515 [Candidatus Eremiobacterota bacterium]